MRNEVREMQMYFCPFGYLDLQRACLISDEVGLRESDMVDIIDEFKLSCGLLDYEKIDPVYCILEHILQMARNTIDKVAGYDFINDYRGPGTEIYTHGNYMCSCYDWSVGALDELTAKITPYLDDLMQDKFCCYLFSELEIGG